MAATTKKTAAEKIAKNLCDLSVISAELGSIEQKIAEVKKLTDNETLLHWIEEETSKKTARYLADVLYLRSRIMYQAQKVATDMSVESFAVFASKLQDALK